MRNLRSALMLGVGGTGGRVISEFLPSTLGGEIYIDAFDERSRVGTPMLTLGNFYPGAPPPRTVAKELFVNIRGELKARLLAFDTDLSGQSPHVILVASLGGGVGGGLFLEVASQCREILGAAARIDGYLCLPTVIPRFSEAFFRTLEANTSLALAELDQAQSAGRPKPIFDNLNLLSGDTNGQIDTPTSWIADYIRRIDEAIPNLYLPSSQVIPKGVFNDLRVVNRELISYIRQNPRALYELHPRKFEEVVAEILGGLGYEITLTKQSRDGGKDLYAVQHSTLGSHLYIVECKRYAPNRPVGVDVVRRLYGVVQQERATMGVVATTSYFTTGAEQFQDVVRFNLSLKGYNELSAWIEEYLTHKK